MLEIMWKEVQYKLIEKYCKRGAWVVQSVKCPSPDLSTGLELRAQHGAHLKQRKVL